MACNKLSKKKDILFLIAIVVSNLAFLISCLFDASGSLLLISFLCEAAFFHAVKWQGVAVLFDRFSVIWSLVKVSIYTYLAAYSYAILPFMMLEVCLILFYQAEYFFAYLATSVPMRNFRNTGKLGTVQKMYERVTRYRKTLSVRPFLYALLVTAILLNSVEFLVFTLMAIGMFSLLFAYQLALQLRYLRSKSYKRDVVRLIEENSPQVIVYVSGARGSSYQLSQWLPVLVKLNMSVLVLARELFWIDDLKENTLPTVYARGMSDLENFISPDTRVCLYPANAYKNTQMMRQIQLKHIFINHGESDKIVNQSRFVRAYDRLYLAGPMAKDRLLQSGVNIEDDQVAYVGRPQTSIFIKLEAKKSMKILYAPTWEGFDKLSNYSSVSIAFDIIKSITAETQYECVFKPHPLTGTVSRKLGIELEMIESFFSREQGKFIYSGNILQLMNDCDLLITDISSVMNDFLCTGKPYIVTNPSHIEPKRFCATYPTVQGGYILNSARDMPEIIQKINNGDPKRMDREHITRYSLGDNPAVAMQIFESELMQDCL